MNIGGCADKISDNQAILPHVKYSGYVRTMNYRDNRENYRALDGKLSLWSVISNEISFGEIGRSE